MSSTQGKKSISAEIDNELVNDVDKTILRMKADGDLPMSYSRSDAIRDYFQHIVDEPEILGQYHNQYGTDAEE